MSVSKEVIKQCLMNSETSLLENMVTELCRRYAKTHEDWKFMLITYDEEATEDGIPVVQLWKWLMENRKEITYN